MTIKPETKDWTWVIQSRCGQCDFDPADFSRATLTDRIRATAIGWRTLLARRDITERPDENTWSPLEYACHVRDVSAVMTERLELMLRNQPVQFPDWDQNAAQVDADYNSQNPQTVGEQLEAATAGLAVLYDLVEPDDWTREGLRGNGSSFTVETLGIYALHDLEHHRADVGLPSR